MTPPVIIIAVAGLALCLLYSLSLTNPHGWSNYPDCSRSTPSKFAALFVAAVVGLSIFLMEYCL
jgi:hypothetical protein